MGEVVAGLDHDGEPSAAGRVQQSIGELGATDAAAQGKDLVALMEQVRVDRAHQRPAIRRALAGMKPLAITTGNALVAFAHHHRGAGGHRIGKGGLGDLQGAAVVGVAAAVDQRGNAGRPQRHGSPRRCATGGRSCR